MTRESVAGGMLLFGVLLVNVRFFIQGRMQRVVAKLAPPATNRPLKNLSEALNTKRVHREYQRLFPVQAKKKFLLMRIVTIAGALCFLAGMLLLRATN